MRGGKIVSVLFFVSFTFFSNAAGFFIAGVEFPKENFRGGWKKRVAINKRGNIFILNKQEGGGCFWTQDFGNLVALTFWNEIKSGAVPFNNLFELCARKVEFVSHKCSNMTDWYLSVLIAQNWSFMASMLAWSNVFFPGGMGPDWKKDLIEKQHQRMRIILETARAYGFIAKLIDEFCSNWSEYHESGKSIRVKPYLRIWGRRFMLIQCFSFYKTYFALIEKHISRIKNCSSYEKMCKEVSLKDLDVNYFKLLLDDCEFCELSQDDVIMIYRAIGHADYSACDSVEFSMREMQEMDTVSGVVSNILANTVFRGGVGKEGLLVKLVALFYAFKAFLVGI